jgi:uncharacterized protein (TIGR03000 family)
MRPLLWCALFSASAQVLFAAAPSDAPSSRPEPATVRVTLPADAKLTIDGHPTKSTWSERLFISPPLEPGKDFHYTLKAQFVRGEKTITVEQTIVVRASGETTVSLDVPAGASASYAPRGPAYTSGRGSLETRAFYYNPESAGTAESSAPPAPRYIRPEGPPPQSSGFKAPFWGTDPSDGFYHSGQ